jgi:hypothetical protein
VRRVQTDQPVHRGAHADPLHVHIRTDRLGQYLMDGCGDQRRVLNLPTSLRREHRVLA